MFTDEEVNIKNLELDLSLISSVVGIGTTCNKQTNLPLFITGLTDGDGTFTVLVFKNKNTKLKWTVKLEFTICASNNPANLKMLGEVQNYFGDIGHVYTQSTDNTCRFTVYGINECKVIREHFEKYPLLTYKLVYFKIWSEVIDLLLKKEHLTLSGLGKIIGLKANLKKGLSPMLREAFPAHLIYEKPKYLPNLSTMNIAWITGFINSDGSFGIYFTRKLFKNGLPGVAGNIQITQHASSRIVLEEIKNYLGFGKLKYVHQTDAWVLYTRNLSEINSFIGIITENNAYFKGTKALDYNSFRECIQLINNKENSTEIGHKKILAIVQTMNSNRTYLDVS